MRLDYFSIARLFLAGVFSATAFAQSGKDAAATTVYFLEDPSGMQWCGYASRVRMEQQTQTLMAMVNGAADYRGRRLSTIKVSESDETGDWAVNDEYTIGPRGNVQTIRRTINIIPEDNSEEQLFDVRDGKIIKRKDSRRELRSGKPTEKTVDWFQPPRLISAVDSFPFSVLITTLKQSVLSKGELCVPR